MKSVEQKTAEVEKAEIIEQALLESVGGGALARDIDICGASCSIFSIDVCNIDLCSINPY